MALPTAAVIGCLGGESNGTPNGGASQPSELAIYHGVSDHPAPWDLRHLDDFERDVGKKVAVLSYFIGFEGNEHKPEMDRLEAIAARGAIPMITWEWNQLKGLNDVISGVYDEAARLWAVQLKQFGGPVFLRWGHEMNIQIGRAHV